MWPFKNNKYIKFNININKLFDATNQGDSKAVDAQILNINNILNNKIKYAISELRNDYHKSIPMGK